MLRRSACLVAALTLFLALVSVGTADAGACVAPASKPTEGNGLAVSISNCVFAPTILHVPVGTTVEWTNADYLPHAVAGAGWTANSDPFGTFTPGKSVTHTFTVPGIYTYMCHLHPGMSGVVIVGDAALSGGSETNAASATGSSMPRVDLPLAALLAFGAGLAGFASARSLGWLRASLEGQLTKAV